MAALSDKQIRFAQEYCVDFNGTQAAIRAGYAESGADVQACRLLANDRIKEYIEERKAELAAKAEITPLWVLSQWKKIAAADPNDITQVRRVCCRHCYGVGHQYQWTENEYTNALNVAINAGKEAPDGMGGFGFDPNLEPAAGCPECGGNGQEVTYIHDTRKLTGDARRLYAGTKKTKDGIQVLLRDQDKALENIAKYLGMNIERKELSGPNGAPLSLVSLKAEDLTDDQLAAFIGIDDGTDETSGGN